MPLIPQGSPMPGMPMMPQAPQAQMDPMMGGAPMMGGPPPMGGGNVTQEVVLGLLSHQAESDQQAAQIMGMGAMQADQSAQAGMMALSALIESMMNAPSPEAVGAMSEPVPPGQAGLGLPPAGPMDQPY